MFRENWDFPFRMLARVLLLGVLLPLALPIFETADSDLFTGIFDDADDDEIIAVLSSLDLKLVAPIPPPPPADPPRLVEGPAPMQAERPAPFVAILPRGPRSPPLS